MRITRMYLIPRLADDDPPLTLQVAALGWSDLFGRARFAAGAQATYMLWLDGMVVLVGRDVYAPDTVEISPWRLAQAVAGYLAADHFDDQHQHAVARRLRAWAEEDEPAS